jgi:2-polyprenyl-6-methoxyphenol hydroxylase-like FAD-dependent oxidoreductase
MSVSAVRQKIGIIGAAVAGPTFALHILSHPILRKLYEPIIYDQSADLQDPDSKTSVHTAGAAVALSPNSLYPLYQLGLKDIINETSTELTGLRLWRASCGAALRVDQDVRDAVPSGYKYLNSHRNVGWSQELGTSIRVIERRHLQSLLLNRVAHLGGEIVWNKKLDSLESLESGATKLTFNDTKNEIVDLLVGADGGWSEVRRHILRARNKATAAKTWAPDFMGATGFYGISSRMDCFLAGDGVDSTDTHGIWLDQGSLSSSLLPNGRMRWDLQIPERVPPEMPTSPVSRPPDPKSTVGAGWESKIAPGAYSQSSSIEILRRYASVWHPVTGTFGRLLAASDRIIRSPLRQRLWGEKEIQVRNSVLIGDASRLMLPSSGQGKFVVTSSVSQDSPGYGEKVWCW